MLLCFWCMVWSVLVLGIWRWLSFGKIWWVLGNCGGFLFIVCLMVFCGYWEFWLFCFRVLRVGGLVLLVLKNLRLYCILWWLCWFVRCLCVFWSVCKFWWLVIVLNCWMIIVCVLIICWLLLVMVGLFRLERLMSCFEKWLRNICIWWVNCWNLINWYWILYCWLIWRGVSWSFLVMCDVEGCSDCWGWWWSWGCVYFVVMFGRVSRVLWYWGFIVDLGLLG